MTRVVVGVTVKVTALLGIPRAVTSTAPVVAPVGTGTVMLVSLQLVGIAGVTLNVTLLDPWEAPKFVPVIVTRVPTGPELELRLVIVGTGEVTKKNALLLATPPTVTTTFPGIAPVGTGTMMLVAFQLVGVAVVPLKVTVLAPCVAPKFIPVIVTGVPTGPVVGFKFVMLGPNGVVTLAMLEYPLTLPAASLARILNE